MLVSVIVSGCKVMKGWDKYQVSDTVTLADVYCGIVSDVIDLPFILLIHIKINAAHPHTKETTEKPVILLPWPNCKCLSCVHYNNVGSSTVVYLMSTLLK